LNPTFQAGFWHDEDLFRKFKGVMLSQRFLGIIQYPVSQGFRDFYYANQDNFLIDFM